MKYIFTEISKRLRAERKKSGMSQANIEGEIKSSHNSYSALESKDPNKSGKAWANISLDKIIRICDALGTDAGHLLGEYEASSNLVYEIEEYTGLSRHTIEVLHYMSLPERGYISSDVQEMNKRTISCINRVLDEINLVGEDDGGRKNVETVFSTMEDYICSTGAWIEDRKTGEPVPFVTVNYGNAPAAIVTVREFLSAQLMERIKRKLDSLRREHDDLENK